MPASEVQGPLGLQLALPPRISGTPRPVPYNHPEDQLVPPGRSRSQPLGEPSQGPSFGRRTQSESTLNALSLPVHALRSPPAVGNAAPERPASAPSPVPPSPVPTEIIPPELTQEEIVVDIQRSGIKVRDFAYEPNLPPDQRPPELFDPVLAWHVYEATLENPNSTRSALNGRHLRRLLDLGWVSEEADGPRWLKQDREALENFDRRPPHPWKALKLTKPKKEELRDVATTRFQWVNADQLVPQFVNRSISRLAAVLRGSRSATPRYQKRPASDACENKQDPEVSPRPKKRRLSTSAESTATTSTAVVASTSSIRRPTPSSPSHFPLTLVNGKPPQQFPAGHPSDSPPRSGPTPAAATATPLSVAPQGGFSRSLQRHLSMASVSSPRLSDLPPSPPSDSRTTLTHD